MKLATLLLALAFLPSAGAQIRIATPFSDHAVLQRDRPIHLWGSTGTPGARVEAHFHTQTVAAVADPIGRWSLYLQPEPAGGPYELTLTGDGPAPTTLRDLLVGDVWFASGQSNMEMPLDGFPPGATVKDAAAEIAAANHPEIRLLLVNHRSSDFPLNAIDTTWQVCTPASARRFSAVAYFFGRELGAREHVPIGLIDSTWGGTPADSWVSLDTLGSDPALLPAFSSRALFSNQQANLALTIAAEKRADEAARAAGEPAPAHPWHPDPTSWLPAALFNGMIAPFTPMTIRGFLWYQGETNSGHDRAPAYRQLFAALIGDWRSHFAQGPLPFLFAQISSFRSPGEDWGLIRDAQRQTLAVANTAMAVTLDVGLADNVHPPDKQTVAARLALAARHLSYGEPVPYQGPMFREATTELLPNGTEALRVWFDHAEGLATHGPGAKNSLTDFEVAGPDHHFVPAEARIEGETILVQSATISHPRYVRFGWNGVVTGNLYNNSNLPASTFTSEPTPAH